MINKREDDEFMIRKDVNINKKNQLSSDLIQSPSIEVDPSISKRLKRRQQKKFKYSKCFMNMTMA